MEVFTNGRSVLSAVWPRRPVCGSWAALFCARDIGGSSHIIGYVSGPTMSDQSHQAFIGAQYSGIGASEL